MQAGPLRHVISIESYDLSVQDTTGQSTKAWTALFRDVRAAITPVTGRELYAASEKLAEATTRVKVRFLPGVTEGNRIIHNGPACCDGDYEIFDIVAIEDQTTKHAQLIFRCKSGLTEG